MTWLTLSATRWKAEANRSQSSWSLCEATVPPRSSVPVILTSIFRTKDGGHGVHVHGSFTQRRDGTDAPTVPGKAREAPLLPSPRGRLADRGPDRAVWRSAVVILG